MQRSHTARRIFIAFAAIVGWAALALQCRLSIDLALAGGKSAADGVTAFLSYFTILTNMLAASVLTAALFGVADKLVAKLTPAVMVYIAIVCGVYLTLLRNLWAPQGAQWVADVALHYVTPVLFAVYWLCFARKGGLAWWVPVVWLIYPLVYGAVIFVRSAESGFYPYPFIDVASLGVAQVAINSLGVMALFLAVGFLVVLVDRRLGRLRE